MLLVPTEETAWRWKWQEEDDEVRKETQHCLMASFLQHCGGIRWQLKELQAQDVWNSL